MTLRRERPMTRRVDARHLACMVLLAVTLWAAPSQAFWVVNFGTANPLAPGPLRAVRTAGGRSSVSDRQK
jgi:hypothetical protein